MAFPPLALPLGSDQLIPLVETAVRDVSPAAAKRPFPNATPRNFCDETWRTIQLVPSAEVEIPRPATATHSPLVNSSSCNPHVPVLGPTTQLEPLVDTSRRFVP